MAALSIVEHIFRCSFVSLREQRSLQLETAMQEDNSDTSHTQHAKRIERVRGIQSGELFVRLHGAALCEPHGTLHGAHPFLRQLLHLQDNDAAAVRRLVQPSEEKLRYSRNLRRRVRKRRRAAQKRWNAIEESVKTYSGKSLLHALGPNPGVHALDNYCKKLQRLEHIYKQHVTSNILHLYALLQAESQYIAAWSKREEATCRDQRALTKLLYQFNSFALQLESETSGQVRMWRLPPSDAQRVRCVKAATENIKKNYLSASTQHLEVLEVYKIDNRVLLNSFQRFTSSLAQSTPDIKIKGLFCSVPPESVERCVVYGMNNPGGDDIEPRLLDTQGAEMKIFNRSVLLQGRDDAPGTSMAFRARSKVTSGTPLCFPRRFSRYSTLEEAREIMTTASARSEDQSPVQYLGLCRVAMGKTIRVKDNSLVFPDDPRVGALHFTNEEEYLVRCPDAVVPEFIIQYRVATPSPPLAVSFTIDGIAPVSLTATTPSLASSGFQDFIYSAAFDSTISAFPLALPTSDRHRFFFAPNELPASSRSTSPDAPGQGEHGLTKKTDEQQDISPEIVLANCVRQKTELREDLQRLERLFWARAREIWEEEAIRSGLKLQRDKRIHTFSEEAQARNQELRGELAMLSQMQDDIDRVTIKPTHKPRAQHSKHPASNSHRRR